MGWESSYAELKAKEETVMEKMIGRDVDGGNAEKKSVQHDENERKEIVKGRKQNSVCDGVCEYISRRRERRKGGGGMDRTSNEMEKGEE